MEQHDRHHMSAWRRSLGRAAAVALAIGGLSAVAFAPGAAGAATSARTASGIATAKSAPPGTIMVAGETVDAWRADPASLTGPTTHPFFCGPEVWGEGLVDPPPDAWPPHH